MVEPDAIKTAMTGKGSEVCCVCVRAVCCSPNPEDCSPVLQSERFFGRLFVGGVVDRVQVRRSRLGVPCRLQREAFKVCLGV